MRTAAKFRIMALASVSAACTGCASYLSTPADNQPVEGVVYYMPRQPIAVQVAVDAKGVETPSIVTASAIPDLRRRFVLSYQNNPLGENASSISVSQQGLLQSAGSTATSGVDTILKNVAGVAGSVSAAAAAGASGGAAFPMLGASPGEAPRPNCAAGQTYTLLIFPENIQPGTTTTLCNYQVSIDKSLLAEASFPDNANAGKGQTGSSGIFYKTEIPYLVSFEDESNQKSYGIALSPDESGIVYLPVERTFFAKNTVAITLKDGMLNQFSQDDTGEIVAASQIPAHMLNAYFTAFGSAFSNFSTASNDANAAAITAATRKLCAAAVAANPITPSMSASDQATAYANIKAACS
jgi:hypothetical protein